MNQEIIETAKRIKNNFWRMRAKKRDGVLTKEIKAGYAAIIKDDTMRLLLLIEKQEREDNERASQEQSRSDQEASASEQRPKPHASRSAKKTTENMTSL